MENQEQTYKPGDLIILETVSRGWWRKRRYRVADPGARKALNLTTLDGEIEIVEEGGTLAWIILWASLVIGLTVCGAVAFFFRH